MLFIAFYIAAQISISDVHIHLKKITYKPYYIVIVSLLSIVAVDRFISAVYKP